MNRWLQILVVVWAVAAPSYGAATEPEIKTLSASWLMDAPVIGEHAAAVIRQVTAQVDQADFAQGEWRQYQVGLSGVKATLTLLHRYDGSASDFPTPAAGAEEWLLTLTNAAYGATVEWTTSSSDRTKIDRMYTHDDRIRLLPRFAADPRIAIRAALQHARLDAMHPGASLVGVLKGGSGAWETTGALPASSDPGQSRLPSLLIIASGSNVYRSKLGRDATMGPACVGWQLCGEERGATATK